MSRFTSWLLMSHGKRLSIAKKQLDFKIPKLKKPQLSSDDILKPDKNWSVKQICNRNNMLNPLVISGFYVDYVNFPPTFPHLKLWWAKANFFMTSVRFLLGFINLHLSLTTLHVKIIFTRLDACSLVSSYADAPAAMFRLPVVPTRACFPTMSLCPF